MSPAERRWVATIRDQLRGVAVEMGLVAAVVAVALVVAVLALWVV
jgi:Flp pilus assembly pilin Flp